MAEIERRRSPKRDNDPSIIMDQLNIRLPRGDKVDAVIIGGLLDVSVSEVMRRAIGALKRELSVDPDFNAKAQGLATFLQENAIDTHIPESKPDETAPRP